MAVYLVASFLFIHVGGWCGLGVGMYRGGLGIFFLGAEGLMGLEEVPGECLRVQCEFAGVENFLPEFRLYF